VPIRLPEVCCATRQTGWTGLISFNDRCRDFGELHEVILQARKLAVADTEKHKRAVPTSELLAA
jgi:hypothetical protein